MTAIMLTSIMRGIQMTPLLRMTVRRTRKKMTRGNPAIIPDFTSTIRGGLPSTGERLGTMTPFTIPGIIITMISGTRDGTIRTIPLTIIRIGILVITTAITRPDIIPISSRIR
jgi:hypothetical protein